MEMERYQLHMNLRIEAMAYGIRKNLTMILILQAPMIRMSPTKIVTAIINGTMLSSILIVIILEHILAEKISPIVGIICTMKKKNLL